MWIWAPIYTLRSVVHMGAMGSISSVTQHINNQQCQEVLCIQRINNLNCGSDCIHTNENLSKCTGLKPQSISIVTHYYQLTINNAEESCIRTMNQRATLTAGQTISTPIVYL